MQQHRSIAATDEIESVVHRLAARAALLAVSKREHPAIVERLSDFIEDRGAVGLLLRSYDEGRTIEHVALSFWNSRIERSGARLEDLVTTLLIGTFSSLIAGILVEMWKGEFGPLKRLLSDREREILRTETRKEPRLRQDLNAVLPFYFAKNAGRGVLDRSQADRLYECLGQGLSFQQFAEQHPSAVQSEQGRDLLLHALEVCRGVVKTEIQRAQGASIPRYHLDIEGMPLSEYLAFGETISLFDADDLGLGPDWVDILRRKLNAPRLYPEYWPSHRGLDGPSPKVIMLDEQTLARLREAGAEDVIADCSGAISTNSGMTSHLAIKCRSLGIGGIGCSLSDDQRAKAKFALFQTGRLKLYWEKPSLTENDFGQLLEAMRRGKVGRN